MNKFFVFLVISTIFTANSYAQTDCPIAKISSIKVRGEAIYYLQEGFKWRKLGKLTEVGLKERYSAMLAVQMSEKKVMVSYQSDSYDCNVENTRASAISVMTYN